MRKPPTQEFPTEGPSSDQPMTDGSSAKRSASQATWIGSLVIASVILLVYLPLVVARFGFGDDFVVLLSDEDLEYAYLADGRPLFALAQRIVHQPISDLGQLSMLRCVSALATAIISVFFFWHTRRLGGTPVTRTGFAISLGLLPSLHTYVAQANFWLAPCMSVVVLGAFAILDRSVRKEGLCRWKRIRGGLVALAMMLAASAAYQPVLSWYWVAVFVLLLDPLFLRDGKFRREVFTLIGLGLVGFVLCFIAFKFYFVIFNGGEKARTGLATNPFPKLYWFLRIQLPLALNHWHLFEVGKRVVPLGVATMAGLVIAGGFWRNGRRSVGSDDAPSTEGWLRVRALQIGLVLAVGTLTHVHWLAIAECPQSYRIIAPLGTTVWIAMYWALIQWTSGTLGPRSGGASRNEANDQPTNGIATRRFLDALAIGGTIGVMLLSLHYSTHYWIVPQTSAFEFMQISLREQATEQTEAIHVIRQGRQDGYVESIFIESFGSPATEREWMVPQYTAYALKELGIDPNERTITQGAEPTGVQPSSRTTVVDMRDVAKLRDTR